MKVFKYTLYIIQTSKSNSKLRSFARSVDLVKGNEAHHDERRRPLQLYQCDWPIQPHFALAVLPLPSLLRLVGLISRPQTMAIGCKKRQRSRCNFLRQKKQSRVASVATNKDFGSWAKEWSCHIGKKRVTGTFGHFLFARCHCRRHSISLFFASPSSFFPIQSLHHIFLLLHKWQ